MAIIGISSNILNAEKRLVYPNKELLMIEREMNDMVEDSGHTAIILPVHREPDKHTEKLIKMIDGLILSGGTDISPSKYGEELKNERWKGQDDRDNFEISLLNKAREHNKPVLGICRGFQLINVAYGGSLYQDILTMREGSHKHRDQEVYDNLGHQAKIAEDSPLYEIFQKNEIYINSIHHQGVKKLGDGLEIMAWSDDGLIEAFRDPSEKFVWAVQWHLEWMYKKDKLQRKIFERFISSL